MEQHGMLIPDLNLLDLNIWKLPKFMVYAEEVIAEWV